MITGYLRGHKIEFSNNQWRYSDNKEPTETTHKTRPCGNCGEMETKEGHDACLGTLPIIQNGCCGHGIIKEAYIQFKGGFSIHGIDAIEIINILKRHRKF